MPQPSAVLLIEDVAGRKFETSVVGRIGNDCELLAVRAPVGEGDVGRELPGRSARRLGETGLRRVRV